MSRRQRKLRAAVRRLLSFASYYVTRDPPSHQVSASIRLPHDLSALVDLSCDGLLHITAHLQPLDFF
jgi:hypothetical protein